MRFKNCSGQTHPKAIAENCIARRTKHSVAVASRRRMSVSPLRNASRVEFIQNFTA